MTDEEEYYRSILDNLSGGMVSLDLEGGIVYINPTACRILHLQEAGGLIGKNYSDALSGFPALSDVIAEVLRTHKTVHRAEVTVAHGGTPMKIGYSTLQVKNRKNDLLGIGILFQHLSFKR